MNTQYKLPILTRVLYGFGAATIIFAIIAGILICAHDSISEGCAVIVGGIFAGIIYIGIGQAVDYLARTAFSTNRICTILENPIIERLRAIEKSSSPVVAPSTLSNSKSKYYYSTDGEQQGPVDASDLKLMHKDGLVTDDTAVLREGDSEWRRFRDYLSLSR